MGIWSGIKDAAGSLGEAIKGAVRGAGAGLGLITNIVKNALSHLLGLPEMVALYLGWLPEKKMRLRVLILNDENGKPVATRARVEAAVSIAQSTLKRELNVKVIGVNGAIVRGTAGPAPSYVLDCQCSTGLSDLHVQVSDIFEKKGLWFRQRLARTPLGTLVGWGAPITIFVIRDVQGKRGCAYLAWYENYGYIDVSALPPHWEPTGDVGEAKPYSDIDYTTLPHELGHCCDLFHRKPKKNLMHASGRTATEMTKWQKSVARTCTHVTY